MTMQCFHLLNFPKTSNRYFSFLLYLPRILKRDTILREGFYSSFSQINLSYCSVTDVGLLCLSSINRLRNMTILHLAGLTPNGLAAALLACGGLTKVKLHTSFKPLLPQHIFRYMKARGCVFHWRNKAFQVLDLFPFCYSCTLMLLIRF